MNKWNIVNLNGVVLQMGIETYKEAETMIKYYSQDCKIVLNETDESQKEYLEKLKNDKEIAKKIISELVEYGLNKRSSSDSRTIFTKRSVKDLYDIKLFLSKNYNCHMYLNSIVFEDYVMDIRMDGNKIRFEY